ncbi:hypothetical protein P152DRAFT_441954 [Eremomyces bilateralis CBS 781.70]|uniref:ceramidase n=1 Tax=Eremomyces bilateralis CBS 781.70 TaxID=1392243 RepID=A0A6G1FU19_9PEZI|nr:uncharacterized protein P152DRAFT_441954 [Eremomyces bilateralis CBS 781.70]KAF1809385.1 hypothetical protein P152DRAFT_441954 [Eremomyces bilateralis CBS 781.70]
MASTSNTVIAGDIPPAYTIDLSLAPQLRYVKLATDFKDHIIELTKLFEEVIASFGLGKSFKTILFLSRLCLRRVYSNEQTRELKGISTATGVDIHLLVTLNVLLDVLMGCTSGGIAVGRGLDQRMLHFRTLDWGMDELRKVVVQLEFVEQAGGPIVARSITYVGFVGILTGVRQGLSISLNFRPTHNVSSTFSNFQYYSHNLLVLLGFRPSISSLLRDMILPTSTKHPVSLDTIRSTFPQIPTSAAYICLCDGQESLVVEKDRVTASTRSSKSFVAATNHDLEDPQTAPDFEPAHHGPVLPEEFVLDSRKRLSCIGRKWDVWNKTFLESHPGASEADVCVTQKALVQWICEYPTCNEYTHYAAIMDPTAGTVAWVQRWQEPIPAEQDPCLSIATGSES